MKTILVLCSILVASLLVIISGRDSNSQQFQRDSVKSIAAVLRPELQRELLKPALTELLNDREFKRELVREISRSMAPETMKAVTDSIASECARDPIFRKEVLRSVVGAAATQFKEMFSTANLGNRSMSPATLMSLISTVTSRGFAGNRTMSSGKSFRRSGEPGEESDSSPLSGDFISVFVSPENNVKTLSGDEARKLFTGEFTNWNQVGGPDLAVKVVTWHEGVTQLQDLVGKRVAPEAVKLRYLSLIIPAVSSSRGAVGFLPTSLVDELPFMEKHEAIRNVSITGDTDTALVAGRRTGAQGTVAGGSSSGSPQEDRDLAMVTLSAK